MFHRNSQEVQLKETTEYLKVVNRSTFHLVAPPKSFRLLMKGEFDLKKLGKKLICAAIAQSTVHNSTVSSWALDPIFVVTFLWNKKIGKLSHSCWLPFCSVRYSSNSIWRAEGRAVLATAASKDPFFMIPVRVAASVAALSHSIGSQSRCKAPELALYCCSWHDLSNRDIHFFFQPHLALGKKIHIYFYLQQRRYVMYLYIGCKEIQIIHRLFLVIAMYCWATNILFELS